MRRQEQERDDEDETDFPENLEDMVTVDATGIYNEDDEVCNTS